MGELFLKLLNMSITASWIVLAVIILRIILKKAPKWINGFLWALVAIRHVFPFSFKSLLSLIPSRETVSISYYSHRPHISTGIEAVDYRVNNYLGDNYFEGITVPVGNTNDTLTVLAIIWLLGFFAMLCYMAVSYYKIKRSVQASMVIEDNILCSYSISTPFILGIIKPKIYLTSSLSESDREYVIAHEKAHLKRRDHFWKPFGFLLLSVYWFNPVLWVAYILLCRDIELACDEKVIKQLGVKIKRPYSEALINCNVKRMEVAGCPLAFGETGVKQRIKGVLRYKKPAFWIITASVIVCTTAALCLLTDPIGIKISEIKDKVSYSNIYSNLLSVEITSNGEEYFYDNATSVKQIIELVEKIRVDKKPISKSRSEDREKSLSIVLNKTSLNFNSDFSQLWIDDGVKPSFTYSVINPKSVKKLIHSLNINFGITGVVSAVECKGVKFEYQSCSLIGKLPHITVRFENNTFRSLCYGEEVKLYYENTALKLAENVGWDSVLNVINPGGGDTIKCSLYGFDISKTGSYRLEKTFYFEGEPDKQYTAYVKFNIGESEYFIEKHYKTSKVLFNCGMYSFVPVLGEQYAVSQDFKLLETKNNNMSLSTWHEIGKLSSFKLDKSVFDELLKYSPMWDEGCSAEEIRKNNKAAFRVNKENSREFYYLLNQKHGDVLLIFGYYGTQTQKSTHIRYVFDLSLVSNERVYHYEESPEEVIKPTVSLNTVNGSFTFSWSPISSYIASGDYNFNKNELILNTDDGNIYTFKISGDKLIFNAEKSSRIPIYKYSSGAEMSPPVPDGAIFK